MTGILKVDQIQLSNGNTPTAGDLGLNTTGTIIQIVTATQGALTRNPMSVGDFLFDTVNITPKFANSKILYTLNYAAEYLYPGVAQGSLTNGYYHWTRLYRNGVDTGIIMQDAIGYQQASHMRVHNSFQYVDTPNTTNQVGYSGRIHSGGGLGTSGFSGVYKYRNIAIYEIAG